MQANFVSPGQYIDYAPAADVAAGAVVAQGNLVGVATEPIPAKRLGALCVDGVFDIAKAAVAVTAGAYVYWDADADPVGGIAGSGALTTTEASGPQAGIAVAAAADTASTVRVKLCAAPTDHTA